MNLYFAGAEAPKFRKVLRKAGVTKILMSFFYMKRKDDMMTLQQDGFTDVFMDSGGYSARVKGAHISVEEYGKFLKDYGQYITVAANLDDGSLKNQAYNQAYLEQFYPVIPVFHASDFYN